MELINRLVAPTPPFFQKVRNLGIILTAIASAVFSLPLDLPTVLTEIAGGVAIAGTVMAGIGQAATEKE
ncbi:hypothetical protein [Chitinophaga barathri]|uniref:Holin n=1 Tax=Chitinophaga barathri TaxID=1647451 RepID=A0A3N4M666_9BACT|nr:hypothetical protein [Chitinophaga barathri]RPD38575.1 hypothetical protein EG028_25255 [Chitinophaga barathri]